MTNYTNTYACRTQRHNKDKRHSSLQKYTSHFIWKGSKGLLKVLLWEGWVGDWTELQHIDPHSYGHNSVSFPFCWAAQPGAWRPSLSGTCSSFQHLLSNWLISCLHPGYIIVRRSPSSCGRHKSLSFNPSTVKVISWYSSTGCTCYLLRCISYFDSLARVNMLHYNSTEICFSAQENSWLNTMV